jgi:hypothetical protein
MLSGLALMIARIFSIILSCQEAVLETDVPLTVKTAVEGRALLRERVRLVRAAVLGLARKLPMNRSVSNYSRNFGNVRVPPVSTSYSHRLDTSAAVNRFGISALTAFAKSGNATYDRPTSNAVAPPVPLFIDRK